MDKEILEILKRLEEGQRITNEKLTILEDGQKIIVDKLDKTYDQVARSAEDITDIKKNLSRVEIATADNWADIARLKIIK